MKSIKAVTKTYTLYPEQIEKIETMFRRTYLDRSDLVRFAINRLFDHPEEWPEASNNSYRKHCQGSKP